MRRLLAACVALLAIACGDSTSPSASAAGTWTLQTVNGAPLPFVLLQVGADKLELTSDVITANSTGSFTQMTTLKTTEDGQVTTESIPDAGTYTQAGTAITFTFNSDGSTGTGTLTGNTVTVASQGYSLVYTR